MAREYGKAWFAMWTDDDFCAQPRIDKLLYNVLIAQPALNYAGVQPINLKRWRKALRDGDAIPTENEVKMSLIRLERRDYVFSDDDTGETLVRSFMRRDEVNKQPNVMLSAMRSAAHTESPKLGCVLLAELRRIDLPVIAGTSDKAAKLRDSLKSTYADSVNRLETLCEGLPEVLPEPFSEDFPEGLSRPAEMEPFSEPFPEGISTGSVVVEVEVAKSPSVVGYVGRGRTNGETGQTAATPDRDSPPPPHCPKHMPHGTSDPCGGCGAAKTALRAWDAEQRLKAARERKAFRAEQAELRMAAVANCRLCDGEGYIGGRVCDHVDRTNQPGRVAALAALSKPKVTGDEHDPDQPSATESPQNALAGVGRPGKPLRGAEGAM